MTAATALVRPQIIRTRHSALVLGNKDLVPVGKPVAKRFLSRHLARQRVHVACPNHRLNYRPDRIAVSSLCGSNRKHAFHPCIFRS